MRIFSMSDENFILSISFLRSFIHIYTPYLFVTHLHSLIHLLPLSSLSLISILSFTPFLHYILLNSFFHYLLIYPFHIILLHSLTHIFIHHPSTHTSYLINIRVLDIRVCRGIFWNGIKVIESLYLAEKYSVVSHWIDYESGE